MDEEARAHALETMKADREKAKSPEQLASEALKAGADPKYVAHRYGFTVERCMKFKAAIEKQEELKRERQNSVRNGNAASSEERAVDAS